MPPGGGGDGRSGRRRPFRRIESLRGTYGDGTAPPVPAVSADFALTSAAA
jgi:hypothetical protein